MYTKIRIEEQLLIMLLLVRPKLFNAVVRK